MATSSVVRRGQLLAVGLIALSLVLGLASDAGSLKVLADLLIVAAALVMVVTLFRGWRESRRAKRAARR